MKKSYRHFTLKERELIAILKGKGESVRSIARALDRSPSSISREMRRNKTKSQFRTFYYLGHNAHQRATLRNQSSHMRPRLKSTQIRVAVRKYLRLRWSPEQIAGRLPQLISGASISHEAIYQFIFRKERYLIPLLARPHRFRRSFRRRHKHAKNHITQRVSITERPAYIQQRIEPGHWEADTAVSRQSLAALLVLTERTSRFTRIALLRQKTALRFHIAICTRLHPYPQHLRRSITYDNGSENANHVWINSSLGTKSYFCQPYHSWEKGTVENTVGLIRRFFPKKTDFATISSSDIKRVEALLNNRPRKCLGFKTPLEIFQKSVALAG